MAKTQTWRSVWELPDRPWHSQATREANAKLIQEIADLKTARADADQALADFDPLADADPSKRRVAVLKWEGDLLQRLIDHAGHAEADRLAAEGKAGESLAIVKTTAINALVAAGWQNLAGKLDLRGEEFRNRLLAGNDRVAMAAARWNEPHGAVKEVPEYRAEMRTALNRCKQELIDLITPDSDKATKPAKETFSVGGPVIYAGR